MIKEIRYVYLGTNGTIESSVHLEDVYYIRKYRLRADNERKKLTKDHKHFYYMVTVPEDEVDQWIEVDSSGQE